MHRLGASAFQTKSNDGSATLKSLLENTSIAKAFFDVRNDSDALYNQFEVYLQGVVDLQLMEWKIRTRAKKYLNGLARCLENLFAQSHMIVEAAEWRRAKQAGLQLFAPERGGDYNFSTSGR